MLVACMPANCAPWPGIYVQERVRLDETVACLLSQGAQAMGSSGLKILEPRTHRCHWQDVLPHLAMEMGQQLRADIAGPRRLKLAFLKVFEALFEMYRGVRSFSGKLMERDLTRLSWNRLYIYVCVYV